PERLQAYAAFPDMLVPVHAALTRLFRIVEVEHLQSVEPDEGIKSIERLLISALAADVIARRQKMTGVEADADPRIVHAIEHTSDLVERGSHRRALTSGVLEQDHGGSARTRVEHFQQRFGNECDRAVLGGCRTRARVKDETHQAERFSAIYFLAES